MSALPWPSPEPPARYPHRQGLVAWLDGLAPALPPAAQMLRLLPLVQVACSGSERLALHRRLWALWPQVAEGARAQARALMDGRYAGWCAWLEEPWTAPVTRLRLAQAHLDPEGPGPADDLAPAAPPAAPDYVLALLPPSPQAGPQEAWLALRARLALDDLPLDTDTAAQLGEQAVEAAQCGAADLPDAMALLFELALRSGDEALATATLAQCVLAGAQHAVAPLAFRRWLEGDAEHPLTLSPEHEAAWLQPRHLGQPAWRARLAASLRRPATLARVQALEAALCPGAPAAEPLPAATPWKLLAALDGCHLLADRGGLPAASAARVEATGGLAPAARAALACALGLQHLAAGNPAAAARELARSRAIDGNPAAREWLARMLALADPHAAGKLAALLRGGSTGGAGSPEAQGWQALAAAEPASPARPLAQAMVARLHLEGRLEPGAIERRQNLPAAAALWDTLANDPAHAEEAAARRQEEPLRLWHPAHHGGPGREHLWFAPTEAANGELLIVPACLDSRHAYAQVHSLRRGLPGHHLLFVNNPEFNWYSDEVFDGLCTLVRERVLPRFEPARVSCYFGSMGGTGALKLALAFGFRALAFNPQVDLDLWAAFRPRQRPWLWRAQRHAQLADWPSAAFEAAPTALVVGSGAEDRLAASLLFERWRACRHGHFIVEKFNDPVHAALLARVSLGPVPTTVAAATSRLAELQRCDPAAAGFAEVPAHDQPAFWQALDAAALLKLEIVLRDGRLFHQPSKACHTRPASKCPAGEKQPA